VKQELKTRMGSENGQTMSGVGLGINESTVASFGLLSSGVANLVNSVVGLLP
jgi:hypothetical protein